MGLVEWCDMASVPQQPGLCPGGGVNGTPASHLILPIPGGLSMGKDQYIFTIYKLSKAYNKREVLKDITLAFFFGAKIGVIGSNGAGKSTLLRVMAGVEKDFIGTARPAD